MVFQIQGSPKVNVQLWGKKQLLPATSTEDLFEWKLEENAGPYSEQTAELKTLVKCCNKRKNCLLAA